MAEQVALSLGQRANTAQHPVGFFYFLSFGPTLAKRPRAFGLCGSPADVPTTTKAERILNAIASFRLY
jgi:hypothetical protein